MVEFIYDFLSSMEMLAILLMIARYVYLEPVFTKRRDEYCFWGIYALCNLMVLIYPFVAQEILPVLFLGGHIVLARRKHRIRGFLMVIPIFGIGFGIIMPFYYIPLILFGISMNEVTICDYLVDGFFTFVLLLFFLFGKKWRKQFQEEMMYRHLKQSEKRALNTAGFIMFTVMILLGELEETSVYLNEHARLYSGTTLIVSMVLLVILIAFVLRGNKASYYEGIAALNEYYFKAEMEHFKAYQKTQEETRRIRHDMKNHLFCLSHLAQEGRLSEVCQYLTEIGGQMEQTELEFCVGNDIVDAICNEKNMVASQKEIVFTVDGKLPENLVLSPLDICTIFSNALDNAIEAVEKLEEEKRWIHLHFSNQGNIQYIRFINPVKEDVVLYGLGATSKEDSCNHGFGMQNIKMTVEKYNGYMETTIEQQESEGVYRLEIVLF